VEVPGCVVAAFRAGVSATDLFNAAIARNTLAEQSTPPSATRGMKKADPDVEFVFTRTIFFLGCLVSLRKRVTDVLRRNEKPERLRRCATKIISYLRPPINRSLSRQGRLDPPSEAGRDYLAGPG